MHKEQKEKVVAELTERLQSSQVLLVADYRGLTMTAIDGLRGELLRHGARFAVVKNTLTRRAAEAAGADALLALLEGPTAIAFLESEGDPVAAAKALSDAARSTRILAIRGGVLEGRAIGAEDVEELAKLPPVDILRSQVLGAVTAPLTSIVGLFSAPLQNLVGLIDARIEQLGGADAAQAEPTAEAEPEPEPAPEAEANPAAEAEAETVEPAGEAEADTDTVAEAEPAEETTETAETTEE
jgi:large subunit ribosomal protein L10